MKHTITFFILNTICISAFCQNKAMSGIYKVPDSINATAFYAEVNITDNANHNNHVNGITASGNIVLLGHSSNGQTMVAYFSTKPSKNVVSGKDVRTSKAGNVWNYDWQYNKTYPMLIATASDSASNKTLYSGYIYLPDEKKWKLLGTRSYADTNSIKFISTKADKFASIIFSNHWLQRSNGSWKALDSQTTKPPSLRQMSNIDSLVQQQLEEDLLRSKLPKDSVVYEEGMFYQTLKEGTGRLLKVTDTLTVHYRGSLFSDGSVFDETKDKPATFPLERLIKGWQLGLIHCKVGGKMRLYLPSGSAYGIRTRSAEIPPNSILVFDVEVLDAKEKIAK